jgi:hypothetical protein
LERIIADDRDVARRRLPGIEADIDYFLRLAHRLWIVGCRRAATTAIEHLYSAVGAIASIDIPVIAQDVAHRKTDGPAGGFRQIDVNVVGAGL